MADDAYPFIHDLSANQPAYYQDLQATDQHSLEGSTAPLAGQMAANSVVHPVPQQPKRSKKSMIIGMLISIVVIILGAGSLATHIFLPASAATVTFVPLQRSLNQTYLFSMASTSNFANNQIAAHEISYTTPKETKQENATGDTHYDATAATGEVVIVPQNATASGAIRDMIIPGPRGLDIDTDAGGYINLSPGQATTVPAHVETTGAVGNIPAYALNGDYNPGDDPGLILHIYNPVAFRGGSNASDVTVVQDSDLTQVQNDLTQQLRQDAQQQFQKMVQPGQGVLEESCAPDVQTQPPSGSPSTTVSASGTVTCTGTVYDQPGMERWVQGEMLRLGPQQFGPHLGFVQKAPLNIVVYTAGIQVIEQSDWIVKFDPGGKKALQRAIAGKSQDEARAILSKQFSVRTNGIEVSGWGLYLPTDPNAIRLDEIE